MGNLLWTDFVFGNERANYEMLRLIEDISNGYTWAVRLAISFLLICPHLIFNDFTCREERNSVFSRYGSGTGNCESLSLSTQWRSIRVLYSGDIMPILYRFISLLPPVSTITVDYFRQSIFHSNLPSFSRFARMVLGILLLPWPLDHCRGWESDIFRTVFYSFGNFSHVGMVSTTLPALDSFARLSFFRTTRKRWQEIVF